MLTLLLTGFYTCHPKTVMSAETYFLDVGLYKASNTYERRLTSENKSENFVTSLGDFNVMHTEIGHTNINVWLMVRNFLLMNLLNIIFFAHV